MAGDDAVGPRVIEHVVANGLDRGFVAVDLSTDALSLVAYLNVDTEAVLVVDAAHLGLAPGDFRFFSPDEVETQKELSGLTTHEGDALKVVELARGAGYPIPPLPGQRLREPIPQDVQSPAGQPELTDQEATRG